MGYNYERDMKRDKEILRLREKSMLTFVQISRELNISKARVRQLYVRLVKEREQENEQRKEVA